MNKILPKVTVIIPTFKRPNLIKKAIENIVEQTYSNIEIIVVNDNGIENQNLKMETYNNIKEFIVEDKIKYIELEKNLGGALARNAGIKASTGEYISFFDDDDEYYPQKIELQVEQFELNKLEFKNLAFVKCEMDCILANSTIIKTNTKEYFQKNNLLKEHLMNLHGIVGTTSFLFKTEVLKYINGFENVSIRQEYMLILKILSQGFVGLHLDKSLVTLTCEGESITRTKNEKKVICMEKVLKKRLSYEILTNEEKNKILKDHYLDLAEWYSCYKRIKSIKYSIKVLQMNRTIPKIIIKIIIKNILGKSYLIIRKKIKGY